MLLNTWLMFGVIRSAQLAASPPRKRELLLMKQCGQTFCTTVVQPLSQTLVTFRVEAGFGFARSYSKMLSAAVGTRCGFTHLLVIRVKQFRPHQVLSAGWQLGFDRPSPHRTVHLQWNFIGRENRECWAELCDGKQNFYVIGTLRQGPPHPVLDIMAIIRTMKFKKLVKTERYSQVLMRIVLNFVITIWS